MSPRKPKSNLELRVLFDTSVIFVGSSSQLLNDEVSKFIKEKSSQPDLNIKWYLPEMVVLEREYQMIKKGLELLPNIEKLEQLLEHKLSITPEIIKTRVKGVIEKQIKESNIIVQHLDATNVDLQNLMLNSVKRMPPFDPNDNEKGFRDAIILETFLQLIKSSPLSPQTCRIIIVTGDKLLIEASKNIIQDRQNVRVLSSLEDLKGLINTFIAEVDEDFINRIKEKAGSYFFEKNNTNTLYYVAKIKDGIKQEFENELSRNPSGANYRENDVWYISKPNFIKKERQRISWATRISVEATAYRKKQTLGELLGSLYPVTIEASQNKTTTPTITFQDKNQISSQTEREVFSKGRTVFEVIWSVSVSITKKFSKPKIESINFIETIWES